MSIKWSEETYRDFEDLQKLLLECYRLDNATGAIDRMRLIYSLALRLDRSQFGGGAFNEASLMNQLKMAFVASVKGQPAAPPPGAEGGG